MDDAMMRDDAMISIFDFRSKIHLLTFVWKQHGMRSNRSNRLIRQKQVTRSVVVGDAPFVLEDYFNPTFELDSTGDKAVL